MSTLRDIKQRQGLPPPKTDADWAKYRADKQARRALNVINAREVLDANGVQYIESADNGLVLFTVYDAAKGTVCYYPEEGRWFPVNVNSPTRFGVRNLVRYVKGELTA